MNPKKYIQQDLDTKKRQEIDFLLWIGVISTLLVAIMVYIIIGIPGLFLIGLITWYLFSLLVTNNNIALKQIKAEKEKEKNEKN